MMKVIPFPSSMCPLYHSRVPTMKGFEYSFFSWLQNLSTCHCTSNQSYCHFQVSCNLRPDLIHRRTLLTFIFIIDSSTAPLNSLVPFRHQSRYMQGHPNLTEQNNLVPVGPKPQMQMVSSDSCAEIPHCELSWRQNWWACRCWRPCWAIHHLTE